jgi:hypothetical protein
MDFWSLAFLAFLVYILIFFKIQIKEQVVESLGNGKYVKLSIASKVNTERYILFGTCRFGYNVDNT